MKRIETEIVVLGGGPGGYAAAFYAADKGKKVILVEQEKRLGGVCLLRGCIPSKALLHTAKLVTEAEESGFRGITFGKPQIDLDKMRSWKDSVITKLTSGIATVAKMRGVQVLYGRGYFEDSRTLRVETSEGQQRVTYQQIIVAVGSRPAMPREFDLGNPRVMTSTEALDLPDIPKKLLVIGGGYIGMELSTVYQALGSEISLVEAAGQILLGADPDLTLPVRRLAEKKFKSIRVNAKVKKMATAGKQIKVVVEHEGKDSEELYDRVLVSVGRAPNCTDLGLENTQVKVDDRGFIRVNNQQQTDDAAIYAIGDVVGGAMLAHKASREARVAVDVISGEQTKFENVVIPAVVFTDPEVAWAGLTESEAKKNNIPVEVVKFNWGASGRALSFDRPDGVTKLIVDPETERILGVGLCGAGAGELIGEGVFAIEMGATAKDLAESVHPHPTLSETLMESGELFYGTATHLFSPRRGKTAEPV
jgi:dihydrolipoamide dehydrogenase